MGNQPITRSITVDVQSTCDRVENQPITQSRIVDVADVCERTENQPITQSRIVDVADVCERVENQPITSTILVDVADTCSRQVNRPITSVITVDVPSTCNVQKTISETVYDDVVKSKSYTDYETVIDTTYTTKTVLIHGSDDSDSDSLSDSDYSDYHGHGHHGHGSGHAKLTKRVPHHTSRQVPRVRTTEYIEKVPRRVSKIITVQEACTAQEQREITEDNFVSESYACTSKQEQQITEDNFVTISEACTRQESQSFQVDNFVTIAEACTRQESQSFQVDNFVTISEACTVQEQQQVTEDNFVTEQYACSRQEVENFTRTETYTEKEPYVETRNVPTTTTNQVPRTVLINNSKQVDSHSIGQEAYTRKQNIAVRRIEDAPKNSIEAVRNDSSRLADKAVTVQEAVPESYDVIRKIPRTVTSTRQRARYNDVDASNSYTAKYQGVSNHNQELIRQ